MSVIINTKIGENRGRARVWLEGIKLSREGFRPGMRYDLVLEDTRIVLRTAENGHFTISRRERGGKVLPIIDICSNELRRLFAGVEMLRVAIKRGTIVITAHGSHDRVKERVERLVQKVRSNTPLDVCSLFHGGGVLDKALHAGFAQAKVRSHVAVAVEMDSRYIDSSLENNPELWTDRSVVIDSPIQAADIAMSAPSVDVLVAGIPCTGASKSGRSKNKLEFAESHPDAGAMFFHFLQFVQALNPAIVVIENVPEYANTASMEVIRSVLGSQGYDVQERVLDGNDFGALERRKRLCVVASSHGLESAQFHMAQVSAQQEKLATVSEILEPLALDDPRWRGFDYLAEKEVRDKAAGKGFDRQLLDGSEPFCGTIGKDYSKCRSTEPFLRHPQDSSLSRIFTPTEHARLKGIPESTVAGLSDTVAHQVLGQSVIYPVFKAVGFAIGCALVRFAELLSGREADAVVSPTEDVCNPQLALI